jgi:hypothetical protein
VPSLWAVGTSARMPMALEPLEPRCGREHHILGADLRQGQEASRLGPCGVVTVAVVRVGDVRVQLDVWSGTPLHEGEGVLVGLQVDVRTLVDLLKDLSTRRSSRRARSSSLIDTAPASTCLDKITSRPPYWVAC